MKDDRLYLIHIRECMNRIERYTADGKEVFFTDPKTQDAVLRNLQTLAESTQRLKVIAESAFAAEEKLIALLKREGLLW